MTKNTWKNLKTFIVSIVFGMQVYLSQKFFCQKLSLHKQCLKKQPYGTIVVKWHTQMKELDELLEQHKKENPPPPELEPETEKQAPKRSRTNFQNTCIFCQKETNEHLFNVRQLNWGIEHLKMAQGI